MVFMLPLEFLAPTSDDELEFSDQIAQLALDPMTTIFEKPAIMRGSILRLCLSKEELMASQ